MRGSVWLITLAVFVSGISVFSRLYATFMAYVNKPTEAGLTNIFWLFALLVLVLMLLGFIMYATERKAGNVKVKNALFERILGYARDAELPTPKIILETRASESRTMAREELK